MRNPKELKEENIEIVFFFAFRYILPVFPTLKEKEENSALPTTRFTVQTRRNYIIIINAFSQLYSTMMLVRSDT